MPEFRIINSDCIVAMREMADNSVDAIVTDPPAGISFMGKNWDHDKGGRDSWIAWMSEVAKECLRVIRPGGHALVWAIPRTSHWTAMGWENAGWEVRDRIAHHFGQGFPKSMNVSIALDKSAGAERTVIGIKDVGPDMRGGNFENADGRMIANITEPTTEAAKQWSGWGTALKPATEDWWLFRKPVEGTVAANILKHGTGGLNIDGCRIGTDQISIHGYKGDSCSQSYKEKGTQPVLDEYRTAQGRFPANLVLSHSEGCKCVGTTKVKGHKGYPNGAGGNGFHGGVGRDPDGSRTDPVPGHADADGMEQVEAWECVEDCPIRLMDEQSGVLKSGFMKADTQRSSDGGFHGGFPKDRVGERDTYGDKGGASRFFYTAKCSKSDRHEGLDESVFEKGNHHPTLKSTALMRWLIRLVVPPNGLCLDPFAGSGSTGKACMLEGFNFIGIEQDAEYCKIAEARIQYAQNNAGKDPEKKKPASTKPIGPRAAKQPLPERAAPVSAQVSIFEIDNS